MERLFLAHPEEDPPVRTGGAQDLVLLAESHAHDEALLLEVRLEIVVLNDLVRHGLPVAHHCVQLSETFLLFVSQLRVLAADLASYRYQPRAVLLQDDVLAKLAAVEGLHDWRFVDDAVDDSVALVELVELGEQELLDLGFDDLLLELLLGLVDDAEVTCEAEITCSCNPRDPTLVLILVVFEALLLLLCLRMQQLQVGVCAHLVYDVDSVDQELEQLRPLHRSIPVDVDLIKHLAESEDQVEVVLGTVFDLAGLLSCLIWLPRLQMALLDLAQPRCNNELETTWWILLS